MKAPKRKTEETTARVISIPPLAQRHMTFYLVGDTPFWYHSFGFDQLVELLIPRLPLTTQEKAERLKHNPPHEFIESILRYKDDDAPTRFYIDAGTVKASLINAAADTPGVAMTQIKRNVRVVETEIPMFGVPEVDMRHVRMGDMAHTPDVRTRAVLPRWCCKFTLAFVVPLFTETAIAQLVANAGRVIGFGDYRQEKGKGSYGLYRIVNSDDKEWHEIARSEARAAQDAAIQEPTFYTIQSERLWQAWHVEVEKRGRAKQAQEISQATAKHSKAGNGTKRQRAESEGPRVARSAAAAGTRARVRRNGSGARPQSSLA